MLDILIHYAPLFRITSTECPTSDSSNISQDIGITPELVACLPTEPLRSKLMDHLEAVLLIHPCINFPYFKSVVTAMFHWADNCIAGSVYLLASWRPTFSFFAATAAGFALGAQCYLQAYEREAMMTAKQPSSTFIDVT